MTADGFVAGPEGQLDWMSQEVDVLQMDKLKELTESMDTIIMGRKMAPEFTGYWENVVNNQPDSPEYSYAKIFVDTPKIVFSRTVKTVEGKNVTVENGDLVESVHQLKKQEGKDIIVYGGANFVSGLIKNNLVDELHLFINPVAIGQGLRIFHDTVKLQLVNSVAYANGIIVNQYKQLATQQS